MKKATVSLMKVSELAEKIGVEIELEMPITGDRDIWVAEYDGHFFMVGKPIENCVYEVYKKGTGGCTYRIYRSLESAITSMIKLNWFSDERKHVPFVIQSVYGDLRAGNQCEDYLFCSHELHD